MGFPSILYPLERGASLFPNRQVVGPDGRVTYREMLDRVRRLAGFLKSKGIGEGDVVAVADVNSVRFMELVYALSLTNSILMPINFRQPPLMIKDMLEEAEAKAFIYSQPFKDLARLKPGILELQLEDYQAWLNTAPYEGHPDPDADYVLLYTSGTTGRPKGVLYKQWKMVQGGLSIAHQLSLYETPAKLSSSDTILSLIPMFHILSWGSVFIAPFIGAKLVFVDKFDPEVIVERIREEKVTWFNAVPTMLAMILQTGAKFDGLKAIIGGSPLPKKYWDLARARGIKITMIYGATDMLAVSLSILTDHTSEEDARLVTHPVPYAEVRIVKEDGSPARPGEIGEIYYRSPWMPEGYYKNPEKTAESFIDGWFRTGDLGSPTEDGGFTILDRIKDAVKSGGEWIPTSVLESIISEVEGVSMVAVIPVEHEKWGERPVAVYVGTASESDIRGHLEKAVEEGRIAKYWIPDYIVRVDELPMTTTGKINKRALREKIKELIQ
ncbi:MAG: AMP-binding protein [Desulfurococcales archaeon]|nr:AMP-binding protein [Desulfurococcales archaeon]